MDTFGFTRKKLIALSVENQHNHMIKWLSEFYQKLRSNRINPSSFELFTNQYVQILAWTQMKPFVPPDSDNIKLWIESISDRIHYHRKATGKKILDYDLLEKVQTDDLKAVTKKAETDCHVALDGLRSLFNVGSIFRSSESAGYKSIIHGNTPGKEHPSVQKTSMGATDWVEQEKTDDLAGTLLEKKAAGFRIIGVETIKGTSPFNAVEWKEKSIIVFGNEEYGISTHVMQVCDEFVHIPMFGNKNSINVANAVSIICFHAAMNI
jgi:23S rRNA (guanosine2251-2'-O)-methyltransferase